MDARPTQENVSNPSFPDGETEALAQETVSLSRRRPHPRMLWVVALLELCVALALQIQPQGETVSLGTSLTFVSWVTFVGAIPGGWLGDRYFGARNATGLGAVATAVSLVLLVMPVPPASYLGLAARSLGVAFLRGNALVLLGRSYQGRERRRLEGFLWVGFAASVGGVVAPALRREFELSEVLTAAVVVALFAGAVVALRRLGSADPLSPADDSQWSLRPVHIGVLAVTVVAVSLFFYGVDVLGLYGAFVNWLFSGSAVGALVIFMAWWRLAARRLSLADNRRIGTFLKLLLAAVVFGVISTVLASTRDDAGLPMPWALLPVLSIGPAAAWFLSWRSRGHPTPSTAGVFSVAFYIQSVACLLFAAMAVFPFLEQVNATQQALEVGFVGATGMAGALMTAAGRSGATTIAPIFLTGTMLGVWRASSGVAGGLVATVMDQGTFDRDTHALLLMTSAAACVLLGMMLHVNRHSLARDEVEAPPPPPPSSRFRRVAMSMSGAAAALGIVLIVLGRGVGGDAVVAAAPPVTFGGAATAHLPNDGAHGFVLFPPVTISFGSGQPGIDPATSVVSSIALGGFAAAKYEVTVAQYRQCVAEAACRPADTRASEGPDQWPVRYLSWFEANEYCVWLEQKLAAFSPSTLAFGSGLHVGLPSEPEWERMALGHGAEGYPWKGPLTPARANYIASGRLAPVQVGQFPAGATAEGIHDLAGNVAEWTRSEYRRYPYNAQDGREDPNASATTRVVRGGSFYDNASLLRVTARQAADPARGYEFVGFRVVITRIPPRPRSQPDIQQTAPTAPPTAQ
jgi:formylglycine-generating enzyme required for sulfatase activity